MCKNYGVKTICIQIIKFSKKLLCEKKDFLPRRAASRKNFRSMLIHGKMNYTSYPENLTTYVKMSQLRNDPSYISKFTIRTELQKKMLPLLPMEKQLLILPQLQPLEYQTSWNIT